jgi:hypothetical protein
VVHHCGERREKMRRIALTGGGILIALGAIGVLDALGLIRVSLCGLLWAFLLIAAGAWIVWGAYARVPSAEAQEVSIPLEGASSARVALLHGAGRLQVKGGAGPAEAARGTFVGGLEYDAQRDGETLNLNMRVAGQSLAATLLPWRWIKSRGAEWSVELNEQVPLTVKIEGGASDNRLDLSALQVKELGIETGASATKLTLPARAGQTRAEVSCGAGGVELRVPSGVAARIEVRRGLAELRVDRSRFPRVGSGLYQSPDYETAANKVDLRVEAYLGSLEVR